VITTLRLNAAGNIDGNTCLTVVASEDTELRLHERGLGVEIIRGGMTVLVPWSSIGSVKYPTPVAPTQPKLTQPPPEPTREDTRTRRAAKRTSAKARDTSRS
jgi:hypothetical protein